MLCVLCSKSSKKGNAHCKYGSESLCMCVCVREGEGGEKENLLPCTLFRVCLPLLITMLVAFVSECLRYYVVYL